MNLRDAMVWDLSVDEIEYVHRKLHMDHYTHAALMTYHTSSPPLHRHVSLRSNAVPAGLRAPIERLLELSPAIGKHDPSFVRAGITYLIFHLYSALSRVEPEELPRAVRLLAACAYLIIAAEKNDNVALWNKKVVRTRNERMIAVMEALQEPTVDVEQIVREPLYEWEERPVLRGKVDNLYFFTMTVMATTIVSMENADDPQRIEHALLHAEQALRQYELDFGHTHPRSPLAVKNPGQTRYRNTLYLYGGMFFEKQGKYHRAIEWYLKDIHVPELPKFLFSFLQNWKTIERLLCAYSLSADADQKNSVRDLIHQCLAKSFDAAAGRGRTILDYLATHPFTDMRTHWLDRAEHKEGRLLYAGEGCRELFFIALLVNKFLLGTDYRDIDYDRFFRC